MKTFLASLLALVLVTSPAWAGISAGSGSRSKPIGAYRVNRYSGNSLANPYGAGSPYRSNGINNPYSRYGSPYSNQSWRNPYATQAPKIYEGGTYRGRMSTNRYNRDSVSNPYGRYGNPYSPDSIRNPYGAGNPYSNRPIYVYPGR